MLWLVIVVVVLVWVVIVWVVVVVAGHGENVQM
jgi:hypothetical protein